MLFDSPVNVDVIEGEVIEQLSSGTLSQALNFIPGVVVTRSPKDGFNVQMQGFDGNHVLVLVDSQPMISATGSSVDLDQINVNNIRQIEVLRGPASVMYGSSAMGGVINIITNKPDSSKLSLNYEVAHYGDNAIDDEKLSHIAKLLGIYKTENWLHQVDFHYIDEAGFDYIDNAQEAAASIEKQFATLSSKRAFNTFSLLGKYSFFSEDKEKVVGTVPGQSGKYLHYISEVERNLVDLSLFNSKDVNSWRVDSRFLSHKETSGSATKRYADIKLYKLDGQKVWLFGEDELVAGGAFQIDELDQINFVSKKSEVDVNERDRTELFAQYNWVSDTRQILAGVRVQNDSDFGWHNAMRLSALFKYGSDKKNQWQWRMGIGQGYRVPDLKQRGFEFDHSALGYAVLGNSELVPEESTSLNSSLTLNKMIFDAKADFQTDFSIHYTEAENLIEAQFDLEATRLWNESLEANSPLVSVSIYQNIQEATLQGFDLSSKLNFDTWQVQLNYSYLDAKDGNELRLTGRPRHQVKANLSYYFEELDLNTLLYAVYQANEAVPEVLANIENNEWTTVNLSFTQKISEALSWKLSLDNIFDEHQAPSINLQNTFDARPISSRRIGLNLTYNLQ